MLGSTFRDNIILTNHSRVGDYRLYSCEGRDVVADSGPIEVVAVNTVN